jgi:UPF0271 protein
MAIDLNSDLGESFGAWSLGDDDAMLAVVTSANVACGFHAGDPTVMRSVCRGSVGRGVAIGAQVSYPDLAGFGRRFLDMAPDELRDAVLYQLGALDGFARAAGSEVSYVKPHGALYNRVTTDPLQAAAVVAAVQEHDATLPLLGLPGSRVLEVARAAGVPAVVEAFADRAYRADGTLVPRTEPGAVLDDPDRVVAQALRIADRDEVVAVDGSVVPLPDVRSICVHGDTPGAVALATRVRAALVAAGVDVAPFV